MSNKKKKVLLSNKDKTRDKYSWYKEQADLIDSRRYYHDNLEDNIYKRMQINYDLCNDILNPEDFLHVSRQHGDNFNELPADFSNKNFISGKIKAFTGMEAKRPFSWNVVATNPEAHHRKTEVEFGMMRDYVIQEILMPIRQQIEMSKEEELQGEELTEERAQEIQQEIAEEMEARTPEQVKKYMTREHKDPAEVMATQLMNFLIQKCDLQRKFNQGIEHVAKSSHEIYYIGILRGHPEVWVINPLHIDFDRNSDTGFIEDGEWARCEYRMSFSQIVAKFGDQIEEDDLKRLKEASNRGSFNYDESDFFAIDEDSDRYQTADSFNVVHTVWKDLRKMGFLTYIDEEGLPQMTLVSEEYEMNPDFGDLDIEWEWIPETYETWKIKSGEPIYVHMRPIPGQFKDIDNLYYNKLPYYGMVYDTLNSIPVSLVDRMKVHQYLYNSVMFRMELLIASDRGKKVLMNIGTVPSEIGLEKWKSYFEASPFMFYDPSQEGDTYNDANTVAKVVDLSLISDIKNYMEIGEFIRRQAGSATGITDQVEGQIAHNDPVNNVRQNLVQSSHILEGYFEAHNLVKKNVITGVMETAKVAYAGNPPEILSYNLDDMSVAMFELNPELLENSTYGFYVANSTQAEEAKQTVKDLAHFAMQNDKIEMSELLGVLKQNSLIETEEKLKVSELNKQQRDAAAQQAQQQAEEQARMEARDERAEEHEREKELIVLKEEERRETIIAQAAITGMSFNPDLDKNRDGINDFLQIAKQGLDADIKQSKKQLEREKFEHQKETDKERIKIDKEKVKVQKAKNAQRSS